MAENKTGKYIKYAIGEIILVMIGILLALQVNQWSNEQKARALEQNYYCRLAEDINQDAQMIKSFIGENADRIKNGNLLIAELQNERSVRANFTQYLTGSASRTVSIFEPSTAAFEDIKSSGNINILKDQSIKNELVAYYAALENLRDILSINATQAVDTYYSHNFADMGMVNREDLKNVIDTTLVDFVQLLNTKYIATKEKNRLLNNAVLIMNTNARNKVHYAAMRELILQMQKSINAKCK